jgi:site-specific recombinase XerD
MSNLIERFKGDLQLAGYAKRSIDSYVSSILRLQRFYNKPLEDISEEQLRQYWLCCQSEFGWSAASLRISYAGIQHFFTKTLIRSWNIFNDIQWKREQTLPTILSLEEVRRCSGSPSPTIGSKALKMVSLNFYTKTAKRKSGKSLRWMPRSLSEDFCSMFFQKDL